MANSNDWMYSVACAECGRGPGLRCISAGGKGRPIHRSRQIAAMRYQHAQQQAAEEKREMKR